MIMRFLRLVANRQLAPGECYATLEFAMTVWCVGDENAGEVLRLLWDGEPVPYNVILACQNVTLYGETYTRLAGLVQDVIREYMMGFLLFS